MHSTVWRTIAFDRASKSNIRTCFSVARSTETVGPIEKTLDVILYRIFQRGEAAIIAGTLQPIDLALGEVLVTAANGFRHVDILDVGFCTERGIGRQDQVAETARGAGPDVEQSA